MSEEAGKPRVVEFNARIGDPETQPIMMRLKSDFLTLVEHAIAGTLDKTEAAWDRRAALGVVMAADGYPDAPVKGDDINGLPPDTADARVFHAGTVEQDGKILVSGGRGRWCTGTRAWAAWGARWGSCCVWMVRAVGAALPWTASMAGTTRMAKVPPTMWMRYRAPAILSSWRGDP